MNKPYTIPVGAWEGKTACIIGGGHSAADLKFTTPAPFYGKRVITINTSFRLCRSAEFVFWADKGWYPPHAEELEATCGELLTSAYVSIDMGGPLDRVNRIGRTTAILSHCDNKLAGFSAGAQALNLAYLLGAKRIVLFGYDLEPGSWYVRKPELPEAPPDRFALFAQETDQMIERIQLCSPATEIYVVGKSKLKRATHMKFEEAAWMK